MAKGKPTDPSEWEPVDADFDGLRAVLTLRFTQPEFRAIRNAAKAGGVSMAEVVRDAVRRRLLTPTYVRAMGSTTSATTKVRAMASVDLEDVVHIPLAVQAYFFGREADAALMFVLDLLDEAGEEIVNVAQARLRDGYDLFGSKMYTWSATKRRKEIIEELADALVYATSGPIE